MNLVPIVSFSTIFTAIGWGAVSQNFTYHEPPALVIKMNDFEYNPTRILEGLTTMDQGFKAEFEVLKTQYLEATADEIYDGSEEVPSVQLLKEIRSLSIYEDWFRYMNEKLGTDEGFSLSMLYGLSQIRYNDIIPIEVEFVKSKLESDNRLLQDYALMAFENWDEESILRDLKDMRLDDFYLNKRLQKLLKAKGF